ncbi:helix-turn-helix domain-containing protein [Pseudidiomarina woesei]|uniref:DNA-binding transcriptional regulator, XRE family n=1 Tax=Pseudidiomarina woesei TaxID=1381080 RepID=A0A0K6GZ04_9GAMM|nr:helix-turn-helix transcriptional regulator [Pseudidiomarina woesei]CUA83961.1 DNA-binding transcriptional regulator, XRE family [Pseudidiomarina woesei]
MSKAQERLFARENLIYNVTEDLLVIMEDKQITKSDLARKLGKSRAYVSQVLSGSRNMTLGSLADFCFALEIEPRVVLPVGPEPLNGEPWHYKTVHMNEQKHFNCVKIGDKKIYENDFQDSWQQAVS